MIETLKEKLNLISETLLCELSEENVYWKSVSDFWNKHKNRQWSALTVPQQEWMQKVQRDLIEEAKKS